MCIIITTLTRQAANTNQPTENQLTFNRPTVLAIQDWLISHVVQNWSTQ